MAIPLMAQYEPELAERMREFYKTLSEKDRRRYAALEARQLGRGGTALVAAVLGCSTRTIERGAIELDQLPDDPAAGRVRRVGGGRKKTTVRQRARNSWFPHVT
jgi:hypothetical protein